MGRTRERPEGLAVWGGPQGAPSGGRGYGWCEGGGKIHGTVLPRLRFASGDAPPGTRTRTAGLKGRNSDQLS
jgi:hypothetical protein